MAKTDVSKLCEDFSRAVLKKGKALPTVYDSSRGDESGFRSESTTYQLKTPSFTAEYTKTATTSWGAWSDHYSYSEQLSVTHGKNSKFSAYHNLGGRTESFGADERYQGSQARKPEEWDITGKAPVTLMQDYLKGHAAKETKKTAAPKTKGPSAN